MDSVPFLSSFSNQRTSTTTIKTINKAVLVAFFAILAGLLSRFFQRALTGPAAGKSIEKVASTTTTAQQAFRSASSEFTGQSSQRIVLID